MKDGPSITGIAAAIGDHARAEVLTALLADRALTASELAELAGVTRQTISAHLLRLVAAGLIAVEKQGRHRYFRLANRDVAALLECLMGVAFRTGALRVRASPREPALRKARRCYDHLAGELGVFAFEQLLRRNILRPQGALLRLGSSGRDWFGRLQIDVDAVAAQQRAFCRSCLDWSERRHHLAGSLGAALFERILRLRWAQCAADSRIVSFSTPGERSFRALLSG